MSRCLFKSRLDSRGLNEKDCVKYRINIIFRHLRFCKVDLIYHHDIQFKTQHQVLQLDQKFSSRLKHAVAIRADWQCDLACIRILVYASVETIRGLSSLLWLFETIQAD